MEPKFVFAPDEPPTGGTPAATIETPPASQTPSTGGQAPTPPAPAAPPAPPAAPVAPPSGWETYFPGAKPEDVVVALRTLKGQIDQLRAQPQATQPQAPEPDLKDLILDDPEKALDRHLNRRVGPVVQEFYEHAANMTKMTTFQQITEKGKPKFPHAKRFEKDIETFMERVDPRLRTKSESWESAYNFVVGANYDKLVEEARAAGAPPIEGAGGQPGTQGAPKITLSPDEARVARGMGMTPEEYHEWQTGTAT